MLMCCLSIPTQILAEQTHPIKYFIVTAYINSTLGTPNLRESPRTKNIIDSVHCTVLAGVHEVLEVVGGRIHAHGFVTLK